MTGEAKNVDVLGAQTQQLGEQLRDDSILDVGAIYQGVKDAVRQEQSVMDHERDTKSPEFEIKYVGKLKELINDPRAEWDGGISAEKRLDTGEINQGDIEHAKKRANDFYVKTTRGATVRCIDGRTRKGFSVMAIVEKAKQFGHDTFNSFSDILVRGREKFFGAESKAIPEESPLFEELGPQIPGGTIAGGVSMRHADSSDYIDFEKTTIAEDARTFGENSLSDDNSEYSFKPGDHQAHPDKPGLGCGAVDGIEETHDKVNPNNITTIRGIEKAVLANDFREHAFTQFVSSAINLASQKSYFESKNEAVEFLKNENPNALPELIGAHDEVLVIINPEGPDTLNTDLYNAAMLEETGKSLQIFGYDLWYTKEMAKKNFPKDIRKQERYVHGRLAMGIAALMYLTDGTQEVGIRTLKQTDLAQAA